MELARTKKKIWIWNMLIIAGILVMSMVAVGSGRFTLGFTEIMQTLFPGSFPEVEVTSNMQTVLLNIRIPRILLALLAGAGLSVAGASFQGLFSNPLATPDTLGVATGASFGAALGILMGLDMVWVQFISVGFGIIAVTVVYAISRIKNTSSLIMIILAGMVVGALFSALVSLVKYTADPQDVLPAITFWLMGSLSGTSYDTLAIGSPFILIGITVIFLLRWKLNAMSLHEDEAKSLGVNVVLVRSLVVVASTMITASIVSMCGLIGWVGLLIPHIARMIFGNDNKNVIPASISIGALFMLVIDTVARSVSAAEIPVSILTAVIGAPFFIILLRRTGGIKT